MRGTAMPLEKGKKKRVLFFFFRERHIFTSRGGTYLFIREAQPLSQKGKIRVFFSYHEMHAFISRVGMDLLPESTVMPLGKGNNVPPIRVFSSGF
jgi:hypothetical protein